MQFGLGLALGAVRDGSAPPPPTIASLYGTGLGQVPLHLDPANAVMSGADVVSIPNSGGAGATLNATASATGITRDGNRLVFPDTAKWLSLAQPFDLIGKRLFMVASVASGATGTIGVIGRNVGAVDGERSGVRWNLTSGQMTVSRWNGAAYINLFLAAAIPGTAPRLVEIEFTSGEVRALVDGVQSDAANTAWSNFLIDRMPGGNFTPYFTGASGDAVALVVNGNQSAQIATVRSALAAKYGLTLA